MLLYELVPDEYIAFGMIKNIEHKLVRPRRVVKLPVESNRRFQRDICVYGLEFLWLDVSHF